MKAIEKAAVKKKTDAYVIKFKTGSFPAGVTEQQLEAAINDKEKDIAVYQKQLAEGKKGDFTGVAFVSLKTEQMKHELIARHKIRPFARFKLAFFGGSGTGLMFRNQKLYVSQAAEPGDVYWENLHYTDKQAYTRKFFGVLLTMVLLAVCAVLIFYLTYEESEIASTSTTTTTTTTSDTTARLLSLYSEKHSSVKHLADSTNDTTTTTDSSNTTTTTTTTTTTDSSSNTTTDSSNTTNTTEDTSSSSTTDDSSTDDSSTSTSTSLIAYALAIVIVIINKGLIFMIPHIAGYFSKVFLFLIWGFVGSRKIKHSLKYIQV